MVVRFSWMVYRFFRRLTKADIKVIKVTAFPVGGGGSFGMDVTDLSVVPPFEVQRYTVEYVYKGYKHYKVVSQKRDVPYTPEMLCGTLSFKRGVLIAALKTDAKTEDVSDKLREYLGPLSDFHGRKDFCVDWMFTDRETGTLTLMDTFGHVQDLEVGRGHIVKW